jgi:hypothetical protein
MRRIVQAELGGCYSICCRTDLLRDSKIVHNYMNIFTISKCSWTDVTYFLCCRTNLLYDRKTGNNYTTRFTIRKRDWIVVTKESQVLKLYLHMYMQVLSNSASKGTHVYTSGTTAPSKFHQL